MVMIIVIIEALSRLFGVGYGSYLTFSFYVKVVTIYWCSFLFVPILENFSSSYVAHFFILSTCLNHLG